ncbi:MAG: helix-turn-helix transcriptional regulator [Pseudomonadota bacterium]
MITAEQCRAARALLNWTQETLAKTVSVSDVSIRAFERGGKMRESNLKQIHDAFDAAGVEFIPENGGGPGVRLKRG